MRKIKYEPTYLRRMAILSFVFIVVLDSGCATSSPNKNTDSNIIEIRVEQEANHVTVFWPDKAGCGATLIVARKTGMITASGKEEATINTQIVNISPTVIDLQAGKYVIGISILPCSPTGSPKSNSVELEVKHPQRDLQLNPERGKPPRLVY